MPDRVRGAALFADISGFTPLTEALADELGSQRGAEELTAHLGRVFHAVIGELDRYGGDVIYFSGDAITCWLDGDDGVRATAAALAMQATMDRVGEILTPGGVAVRLALKIAVACGDARRFVVGDPEIQLIDVLAGRLIDDLADAEHEAGKGEVVLDSSAVISLGKRVRLGDARIDPATGKTFRVVRGLTVEVPEAPAAEPEPLAEELVRPWLLPAVYERIRSGRGEFLAELRPAYPLFLRFGGINYDDDEDAIGRLDDFVQKAQRVMAAFGGNVLQLTLGDKGAYLYGVFGSPVAHEDDADRACAAALELRDLETSTSAKGIQVGVTHGRLRSGTYGHVMRRTFVCLGDAVNLAARLMSAAPAGQVYISDDVRDAAGDGFIWRRLPDLTVKGKSGAIVAHQLTGSLERASRRRIRFQLPLVGRRAELGALNKALADVTGGSGRIVGIAAEAGMGKSRLVAEFVRLARRRGLTVAFGECQSFGATAGYSVWREIWRRLLNIDDTADLPRQRSHLATELQSIDPELVARTPLLGSVLGLDIPDTELTATFDAKLRKASLEDLLARCLAAHAAREPIVLVLEDCHWIDELSRDLLTVLGRTAAGLAVLIVLAYRPATDVGGGLGLERLPWFAEVALDHLDLRDAAQLIRSKLEQVSGPGTVPSDALVALVTERSGGNPFYVEELITFISGRGIDLASEAAVRAVELPESLHSLVLGRIDTVEEGARRTLKVASVVGRVFEAPLLPGAYPELGPLGDIVDRLGVLRAADLVAIDRETDQTWLFKHVVTQQVAYESLPFAVRAMLHGRIGRRLEADAGDGVDQMLDLLAHHFSHSDDQPKKIEYLRRAAVAAQAAYSNAAAIDYYERLAPLLEGVDRVATMLKLAKVLQLVGELGRARAAALEARTIAADLGDVHQVAWADASLAETAKRQSRFEEATSRLDAALGRFGELEDASGIGDMLHLAGVIAQLQGDYATAKKRYEDSRHVREGIDDWAGVATTGGNLAILAEFDGDYAGALRINDDALGLRRRIGDRRGIGIGEMNAGYYRILTGDLASARKHLGEALRLSRELGDRAMIAHSTFTLGNAERDLGDHVAAAARYVEALELQRELDDRFSITFIIEDVGVLLARAGQAELGFELLGGAEAVRQQIGSPRPSTLDVELAGHFATAREALGDAFADSAVARGRAWSFEEAIDAALHASSRVAA